MIDWSRPYSSTWKLFKVDRNTWADEREISGFLSASITRDCSGEAPQIESAQIEVKNDPANDWEAGYYRISMIAIQDDGIERVDIATLLCESESGKVEYGFDTKTITGRSVLYPAASEWVADGACVLKGEEGVRRSVDMLSSCVRAPVSGNGFFSLADHFKFDFGSSVLESVWKLLSVGGWCIFINGRGEVSIQEKPTSATLLLDRANASLLYPSVSYELDWSEVPNRYTVKDGVLSTYAANETGDNPASHKSRGYWVDDGDSSPVRLEGESLQAYADRKLEEKSTIEDMRTYTRRWYPNVHPFSLVRGSLASVRLDGDMRIKTQKIECSHGITLTETAAMEVVAWKA